MHGNTHAGTSDRGPAAADPDGADGPDGVTSRAGLATALTALRTSAGLSVRQVVAHSGGLHGTVSGWFSGQHLPNTASFPMFDAVLQACGVTTAAGRERWHASVVRARENRARSSAPYRGLEPFEESDAQWFFGREQLSLAILDRLGVGGPPPSGPLFVIGQSGSGKSSVLRAGVVPALRDPARGGRPAAVTTPLRAVDAVQRLRESAGRSDAGPPVLVVDQLEELWTSEMPGEDRAAIRGRTGRRGRSRRRCAACAGGAGAARRLLRQRRRRARPDRRTGVAGGGGADDRRADPHDHHRARSPGRRHRGGVAGAAAGGRDPPARRLERHAPGHAAAALARSADDLDEVPAQVR